MVIHSLFQNCRYMPKDVEYLLMLSDCRAGGQYANAIPQLKCQFVASTKRIVYSNARRQTHVSFHVNKSLTIFKHRNYYD